MQHNKKKMYSLTSKIIRNFLFFVEALIFIAALDSIALILFLYTLAPLMLKTIFEYILPFLYYGLTGQATKASEVIIAMQEDFNRVFKRFQNITYKNLKKVLIGLAIGSILFLFNVNVTARLLGQYEALQRGRGLRRALKDYPGIFNWLFKIIVIRAPLLEEIAFRGVLLNGIKLAVYACSQTMQFAKDMLNICIEVKNKPVDNSLNMVDRLLSTIRSLYNGIETYFTAETPANAEPEPATTITDRVASVVGVGVSGLLFSKAHLPVQQPYTLVGGMALGALHEYYAADEDDNELAPCVGAHMANNYLAIMT